MVKDTELLGKVIKCKQCGDKEAYIYLEESRYRVSCIQCGYKGLLKEQRETKQYEQLKLF